MWNPDAEKGDAGSASSDDTGLPKLEERESPEEPKGSLIITCNVVFPGILGGHGRLKSGEDFQTEEA